jgi:hypothetical protein
LGEFFGQPLPKRGKHSEHVPLPHSAMNSRRLICKPQVSKLAPSQIITNHLARPVLRDITLMVSPWGMRGKWGSSIGQWRLGCLSKSDAAPLNVYRSAPLTRGDVLHLALVPNNALGSHVCFRVSAGSQAAAFQRSAWQRPPRLPAWQNRTPRSHCHCAAGNT